MENPYDYGTINYWYHHRKELDRKEKIATETKVVLPDVSIEEEREVQLLPDRVESEVDWNRLVKNRDRAR